MLSTFRIFTLNSLLFFSFIGQANNSPLCQNVFHYSLSQDVLENLMMRGIMIFPDYTTDYGKLMLENGYDFSSGDFKPSVFYPIGANLRLLVKDLKDTEATQTAPEYRDYPFLRSNPTVVPGKNIFEQKVYMTHQILMQTLYFHFNESI